MPHGIRLLRDAPFHVHTLPASSARSNESRAMRNVDPGALASVAVGGAIGSVARFLFGTALIGLSGSFPFSTLAINVLGSFLLGFVVGLLPPVHTGRLLFGTGFCGGFTTFSAFSGDVVTLLERGEHFRASAYIAATVALSLIGMLTGIAVGRIMGGGR